MKYYPKLFKKVKHNKRYRVKISPFKGRIGYFSHEKNGYIYILLPGQKSFYKFRNYELEEVKE